MKRSRFIAGIAAALIAGFVLGGVGISMAGTRATTPAPSATVGVNRPAAAQFGTGWGMYQPQSGSTTVASAPRTVRATADRAKAATHRSYMRGTSYAPRRATTNRTTTRRAMSGSYRYCAPRRTSSSGNWGCCW